MQYRLLLLDQNNSTNGTLFVLYLYVAFLIIAIFMNVMKERRVAWQVDAPLFFPDEQFTNQPVRYPQPQQPGVCYAAHCSVQLVRFAIVFVHIHIRSSSFSCCYASTLHAAVFQFSGSYCLNPKIHLGPKSKRKMQCFSFVSRIYTLPQRPPLFSCVLGGYPHTTQTILKVSDFLFTSDFFLLTGL